MKIIFLIIISISILNAGFTRKNDIVIDDAIGLQWQDEKALEDDLKWEKAIQYCEDLELGGHNDWRLPNINELKTIVDLKRSNPAIVSEFENTSYGGYWSSTSISWNKNHAWEINFNLGNFTDEKKVFSRAHTRCVRGGLI